MRTDSMKMLPSKDRLGCFGNFNIEDNICRKFCALSLRCSIENDQNSRMELLEDLLSAENLNERIQ